MHSSRRWSLFSQYRKGSSIFVTTPPKDGSDFHLQRIFTDADLYNHACLDKITEAVRIIEDFIAEDDIQKPEEFDLVLDLDEDDDGKEIVYYYFADHEKRIIVFLHEFPSNCLPHWYEVKGVSSGTHLRMSSLPSWYTDISHIIKTWFQGMHWKCNTGN